jgi:chitin disaccharide deacetylase
MNNKDQHSETKPVVALHRNAELKTLLSAEFQDMVKKGRLKLVTYRDLIRQDGPKNRRQ